MKANLDHRFDCWLKDKSNPKKVKTRNFKHVWFISIKMERFLINIPEDMNMQDISSHKFLGKRDGNSKRQLIARCTLPDLTPWCSDPPPHLPPLFTAIQALIICDADRDSDVGSGSGSVPVAERVDEKPKKCSNQLQSRISVAQTRCLAQVFLARSICCLAPSRKSDSFDSSSLFGTTVNVSKWST